MGDGLWNIINEMKIVPNSRTDVILHTKYLLWKDHALAMIVLSVESSHFYLVGDPGDLVVVWEKLADQFWKKTWSTKLALRRRKKLKEGDSVHKHIKLMMEIFEELSVIGDSIDEADRVLHLLGSLPDSYDMLMTALKASQDVLKWALMTEWLLYAETKIREKETGGAKSTAIMLKHHINKRWPKYFKCGKNGHMKHNL